MTNAVIVWNVLSGVAAGAVAIALVLAATVVWRLVVEARATGTTRHKLPVHIVLVGAGTIVWGLGQGDTVLDHVGDGLAPEWSAAPTGLVGGLLLIGGLWKMVEVQSRTYRTLGGVTPASDIPNTSVEGLTRLRVELRVINAVLLFGIVFGFAQTESQQQDTERVARSVVEANREGCEQANVLRRNQAQLIREQLDQTDATLRRPLGALESFRKQIEGQQQSRRDALTRLRISVALRRGKASPYEVNCETAYPFGG